VAASRALEPCSKPSLAPLGLGGLDTCPAESAAPKACDSRGTMLRVGSPACLCLLLCSRGVRCHGLTLSNSSDLRVCSQGPCERLPPRGIGQCCGSSATAGFRSLHGCRRFSEVSRDHCVVVPRGSPGHRLPTCPDPLSRARPTCLPWRQSLTRRAGLRITLPCASRTTSRWKRGGRGALPVRIRTRRGEGATPRPPPCLGSPGPRHDIGKRPPSMDTLLGLVAISGQTNCDGEEGKRKAFGQKGLCQTL